MDWVVLVGVGAMQWGWAVGYSKGLRHPQYCPTAPPDTLTLTKYVCTDSVKHLWEQVEYERVVMR